MCNSTFRGARRCLFKNANNFRDLGGYSTADNHMVKWGRLFRSDSIDCLTKDEWSYITDTLNISSIIDLRNKEESQRFVVRHPQSVYSVNIPLISQSTFVDLFDENLDISSSCLDLQRNMNHDYSRIFYENTKSIALVLSTINSCLNNGAVLFFCSAGKDRTGIIAALILLICGVPEDDIVADYCISEVYNNMGINQRLDSKINSKIEAEFSDELDKMKKSSPSTMRTFLNTLQRSSFREKLNRNGFLISEQCEMINQLLTKIK